MLTFHRFRLNVCVADAKNGVPTILSMILWTAKMLNVNWPPVVAVVVILW